MLFYLIKKLSQCSRASWVMIRCDHEGLGCTAGFYLERGSAYYILPVLSSTLNVKVHQGSVKLQIQLWVVSVQKDCVTSARDTYPVNPVWVESTVHRHLDWMSYRLDTYVPLAEGFWPAKVPGGNPAFLLDQQGTHKMKIRRKKNALLH